MSRLIGVVVWVISVVAIGAVFRKNEQKRIDLIDFSVRLLIHARRKIDLFATPFREIFSDFSDVRKEKYAVAQESDAHALMQHLADTIGSGGVPLLRFSAEIGIGYKEDALRVCDFCIGQMRETLEAEKEAFRAREKLYIVLPLLLAVSVVILLL